MCDRQLKIAGKGQETLVGLLDVEIMSWKLMSGFYIDLFQ